MLKKYKIPLIVIATLVLLYTLVGFLVIPAVLESQLPKIVQEVTGRETSVEEIKFNPYAMTLSVNGYETRELDGPPLFVGVQELFVNFQPWDSIFKQALTFEEVRIDGFYGHIAILADNLLNFSDLLELGKTEEEAPPEDDDEGPFPIWITDIRIQNSEVEFDHLGLKKPFTAKATPINLHFKNLTTLVVEGAPSTFSTNFESGGSLQWQGKLSLNPLRSSGKVNVEGMSLRKIWWLIQGLVNFEIKEGGIIKLAADYTFDGSGDDIQFRVPSAKFNMDGVKLSEKGQDLALIDVPGFAIDGIAFDLAKQLVTVAQVSTQNGVLKGWLSPDGVFNYQTLFVPADDEGAAAPPASTASIDSEPVEPETANVENPTELKAASVEKAENNSEKPESAAFVENEPTEIKTPLPETKEPVGEEAAVAMTEPAVAAPAKVERSATDKPWVVTVKEVSLNSYTVHLEDRTQNEVIAINLTPVNIKANNFSTTPGSKFQVNTDITVNESGSINISGDVGIDPVLTDLELAVEKIALNTFQPYLDSVARLELVDGAANIDGKFRFSLGENNQPLLNYSGNASVVDMHTTDARNVPAGQKDIFKWNAVKVNGVEFDLDPMKINVGGVETDGVFARVIINKDGTTNMAEIFTVPEAKKGGPDKNVKAPENKTAQAVESKAEIPPITIGRVKINNASAFFADLSLILPFAVQIDSLNGGVKGLSSDEKSRANVYIQGKVDQVSPVTIEGNLAPFHADTYSDIKMQFESVNLTTATPYMAQFAGYKIDKGTISLNLNYKISRRQLEANNQVIIDQLTLGEEVDSPDAVSLPIKLAIALLTDSDGVIDLELPISGSLDDPEFSIGRLVGKVLVNLVKKVVLSPFTMIASLAGSDDDLSRINFGDGLSSLSKSQRKRLDSIATGLKERPELQIEVRGTAYQTEDWPVIADDLLTNQLKQRKWNELNKKRNAPASPKQIELSISDYEELLGEMFTEKFPLEAETFKAAKKSDDPKVKQGFYTMAKDKLVASMPVDETLLKVVAKNRAENISKYLIEQGKIPHSRIFLMDLQVLKDAPEGGQASVPLTLTAS